MRTNSLPILVAEGSDDDRRFIERAFRRIGIDGPIEFVANGNEAKAYLAGDAVYADRQLYPEPCVIFTDCRMPMCDGFELLDYIRADPRWRDIPVIFLSSSTYPPNLERALAAGATAYHLKPFTPGELEELLRSLTLHWISTPDPPGEIAG